MTLIDSKYARINEMRRELKQKAKDKRTRESHREYVKNYISGRLKLRNCTENNR